VYLPEHMLFDFDPQEISWKYLELDWSAVLVEHLVAYFDWLVA